MPLSQSWGPLLSGVLLAGSILAWPVAAHAAPLPGPLYKLASSPTVYVEHNGTLHAIASPAMLYDLGYTWQDLHTVKTLPVPIGTPITLLKLPSSPAVYLEHNGHMHWIASAKIFNQNGFQWANVYTVSQFPAPIGSPITSTAPPNNTRQVGWQVFTANGVPVSSAHPVTSGTKLLVEPVDAAGAIVPDTLADTVSLTLHSNAPPYQGYLSELPYPGTPPLVTVYASPTVTPSYTFTGSAFGINLGVNSTYPATFSVSPQGAANATVTGVTGPSSAAAPVVSAPVSNSIGQIQVVHGIQPNQTYSVQLQLETSSGQPVLGIAPLLGSQAYPTTASPYQSPNSPNFTVSTGGRATPSTLTFGHLGTNHVYLTYHTGSAHNVPDVLSLYGTQNVPGAGPANQKNFIPVVELVTNAF